MINRRRALLAGAGAGLLLPQRAEADSLFTNFAFRATSTPTPRTMPNRLAEIYNVLDFGADPTGANGAATTAAIQAAKDAAAAAGGGTVFIPTGFYRITGAITLNEDDLSICFLGQGTSSHLDANTGTFYIFDRHPAVANTTGGIITFEKMNISNGSVSAGGGAIRLGSTIGASFRDLTLSGFVCLTTEDSAGVSSQNICIQNCLISASASGSTSRGVVIGGSGSITGCNFPGGSDIAVLAYGSGLHIAGNRIENCVTGYQLGLDSGGNNVGLSGFSLISGSTEGNLTGTHMAGTCSGGFIGYVSELGHPNSGPGEAGGPTLYGLLIDADCAQACTFYGISPSGYFDTAAISIANASTRANNVFINCRPDASLHGSNWVFPTNAQTAQFINCNGQPIWTYAQLPTGGNVIEGDEFNISDGTNSLAWGATATNTGTHTTHYLVRYNGSAYTVVGK